ncbi:hypothetical protein FGO68_gene5635 [Halteria grandinella]|uniref:Uncharacterized protein n=1 Tax=Halteria grandinella TaxID=5974 RepID=A0A8J8P034_HALGN|nr:hypothetical protein FGO68_gene5635 [Halteria grandinella]
MINQQIKALSLVAANSTILPSKTTRNPLQTSRASAQALSRNVLVLRNQMKARHFLKSQLLIRFMKTITGN